MNFMQSSFINHPHLLTSARPVTMSDDVRASHLLVKHQGSRRPASWRDPDGTYIPKKTKEAALDELLAYRDQIEKNVVSFADLAAKVSDCSSAKHGGDLGFFGRGKMQKAFEVRGFASQEPSIQPATQVARLRFGEDAKPLKRLEFFDSVGTSSLTIVFLSPSALPSSSLYPNPLPRPPHPRTARTPSRSARCQPSWIPTRGCTSSCERRRPG